jgi:20S proteasome subunit beta 1
MAVAYAGGVVLGADSRTSTGSYVANRTTDKLTPLAERVYVCRSGSAADTQNISRYLVHALDQHRMELGAEPAVAAVARLAQEMCYANKAALQAGLIVAGWDAAEGGAVYAVPLGGTLVRVPLALGGSGSGYIQALVDCAWRADMSEEEAKAFVVRAVRHAIARDGSSGGCVRTVVINARGVFRDFLPGTQLEATFGELPAPEAAAAAAALAAA